jgi:hypothetical protein
MNDEELKTLVDEVAAASGYGGLDMGTMYGEFAFDVAKRALQARHETTVRLLTHIKDVVDDANWLRIDHKLWNAVTTRSNEVRRVKRPKTT